MCLIAWNWDPTAALPFIVIANRDEYYARATKPMGRWDNSHIWAGQDLEAGGTWLGVTVEGKMAALTNHRAPHLHREQTPSRGHLVRDFLESDLSAVSYSQILSETSSAFNPFNLLLFDGKVLLGFESRLMHHTSTQFKPGNGQVSNGGFMSPWPKAIWLQTQFTNLLERESSSDDDFLDLLLNDNKASDSRLPQTGISLDRERALSSPFIRLTDYGTRASSLVKIFKHQILLKERTFGPMGLEHQTQHHIQRSLRQGL